MSLSLVNLFLNQKEIGVNRGILCAVGGEGEDEGEGEGLFFAISKTIALFSRPIAVL
tara:strand:+ start:1716 stop:1886 length:171 start_codon:yes stop_codon:yes gene_type:complete